ncbi:hypothetical protein [Neobacillus drentensis]|uniref:hypothetical protein n=1 Tax=Neobacillus drentensis TaxID=220684 RepID=UPI000BF4A352|nr:hypothetical protein CN481_18460 [Bacillus sp. AFS006103]
MSDKTKTNNQSVSEGIKETAGAAFHVVHSALETTENVAMSAVDATSNAVSNLTGNANNTRGKRHND